MSFNAKSVLVSFSGIDGAGKSTQIERLQARLSQAGVCVLRLAFWDNVVFLPGLRADISHKVLGGELGVGAPGKPVARNDKNVNHWYLTLARSPFYLFDVLSLRRVVAQARASHPDVIIFDRYIYDQLAHLTANGIGRAYVRSLLQLAPRPDLAFLLDAIPEAARERKPEYPLNFLYKYRNAYHRLCSMAPEIFVTPPFDADGVERTIWEQFQNTYRQRALLNEHAVSNSQGLAA